MKVLQAHLEAASQTNKDLQSDVSSSKTVVAGLYEKLSEKEALQSQYSRKKASQLQHISVRVIENWIPIV